MASLLLKLTDLPIPPARVFCGAVVATFVLYVIYQRYFHPLAAYPGPFWASITDLWQVRQFLSLRHPHNLTRLHEKYGQFVRYGPNKLSITTEDVVPLVYQRGGRRMPKTEFYNGFGSKSTNANVFRMRDVELHSMRRRHMSNSFSLSRVKTMEHCLDDNIRILRNSIAELANEGKAFDLNKLLQFYIIDVLGELAFSHSFGIQTSHDESAMPPVVPSTLLGSAMGAWPAMTNILRKLLPYIPHKGLQDMGKDRAKCARLASECVQRRIETLEKETKGDAERTDLLENLILAKHPDTGEKLTRTDLEAEAFGFIIAGTHTTSATVTLLFWNLLHNPELLGRCVQEVHENLPTLDGDKGAYSVTEAETSLPFLRLCIRENYRLTPVFTMPLERRVAAPEGIIVSGRHIGQGTSVAVCNYAFHHNPAVWGDNHNVFDPSRWLEQETADRARYLMHFGSGNRQCLGKTLAQTNIYKLTSTLLHEFDFQLADPEEKKAADEGKFIGKLPEMVSVGISDLEGPLMVIAKPRAS